jgi:hypothetical protein
MGYKTFFKGEGNRKLVKKKWVGCIILIKYTYSTIYGNLKKVLY